VRLCVIVTGEQSGHAALADSRRRYSTVSPSGDSSRSKCVSAHDAGSSSGSRCANTVTSGTRSLISRSINSNKIVALVDGPCTWHENVKRDKSPGSGLAGAERMRLNAIISFDVFQHPSNRVELVHRQRRIKQPSVGRRISRTRSTRYSRRPA
jgi:hypothetical protein